MKKVIVILVFLFIITTFVEIEADSKRLLDIKLDRVSFNPTIKERCVLSYQITEKAIISIFIYSADFDLIQKLEDQVIRRKGFHQISWDGLDQNGRVVPNETYFFCIEAKFKDKKVEVYDPTTFSGGEEFEIAEADFNREKGYINFSLPKPARVSMRIGIRHGAMVVALLDWEPKPAGDNLVYWTGYDEDRVWEIKNHPSLTLVANGFYLPDTSVITYGNKSYDYFTYKKSLKTVRKAAREEAFRTPKISPNYYYLREEDRAPRFRIELPQHNEEIPKVKGELIIRIIADDDIKKYLLKNRFEVILFCDGEFVFEEEEGYIPFNLVWNSRGIKPGEHYLTINLATYLGQMSSKTIKIYVEK